MVYKAYIIGNQMSIFENGEKQGKYCIDTKKCPFTDTEIKELEKEFNSKVTVRKYGR